jgi:hypothetical protein
VARYWVNDNAQSGSNDHEVHKDGCSWLALIESKTYLGDYPTCQVAVKKAKTIYRDSNGCIYCSPTCHTT